MKIGSFRLAALSRKALAVAGSLACFASASSAQDASVLITSFSWTTTVGTTLSFFNPDQNFYTNAQNGGGVFGAQTDQFDTNDYDPAIAGVNLSNAQAALSTFDPQTFWATASTTRSSNPPGTPRNQATADGFQSGDFALDGPGTVTFIIDYTLSVAKPGGSLATDYASAVLNFATSFAGQQPNNVSDQLLSFSQLNGTASKDGEFRVDVTLLEDQVGSYTLEGVAQSFAVAAVPEPQEWAMLASGFVVLGGFLRRRRMHRS